MYKFVCFDCRKGYTKVGTRHVQGAIGPLTGQWIPPHFSCPDCGGELTLAGDSSFRIPPQRNINQWRKVELLVRNGFTFAKHILPYPQKPPTTLWEARKFVREWRKRKQQSEQTRTGANEVPRHGSLRSLAKSSQCLFLKCVGVDNKMSAKPSRILRLPELHKLVETDKKLKWGCDPRCASRTKISDDNAIMTSVQYGFSFVTSRGSSSSAFYPCYEHYDGLVIHHKGNQRVLQKARGLAQKLKAKLFVI